MQKAREDARLTMQFGNRNSFAICIEPLFPSWERRFPAEIVAWARFSMWVEGKNICRNRMDGSVSLHEGVNVPLAPIADWLARSWTFLEFEERPGRFPLGRSLHDTVGRWGESLAPEGTSEDEWLDERESWWSRHFLLSGADGANLPNVSLVRGDDCLVIEWAPAVFVGSPVPRFLSDGGRGAVGWAEGKETLAQFVAYVAQCLRDVEQGEDFWWACLDDPLNELKQDFSKSMQAYTGISLEILRERIGSESDAGLRAKLGLQAGEDDPAASVVTQVLRDLPPGLTDSVWKVVWKLEDETRSVTGFDEELRNLTQDAVRSAGSPEESGYRAAIGLRDHLGLNGQPIEDVDKQLSQFGVRLIDSGVPRTRSRMLAGSRKGRGAVAIINRTPRTSTHWGRRFEAARALGHLLMDPYRKGTIGAASTNFAQPRARRRAGCFAAELLLPREALQEAGQSLDALAEPERFAGVLKRFGVGARTAANHLWNRKFLSSTQIRDSLIGQFSKA